MRAPRLETIDPPGVQGEWWWDDLDESQPAALPPEDDDQGGVTIVGPEGPEE